MLHAIAFDALSVAKKLEASGRQEIQQLDIKIDKLEARLDTKIDKLEIRLDTRIDKLSAEVDTKLAKLKSELITWVVSIIFAQTAILSIIKFIHPS